MSHACAAIDGLATDAGMSLRDLAVAADIRDVDGFVARVEAHESVSSLEVALVAQWSGRDPLWIIAGWTPQELLGRFCDETLEGLSAAERRGFNVAWGALSPFLPAHVVEQVTEAVQAHARAA